MKQSFVSLPVALSLSAMLMCSTVPVQAQALNAPFYISNIAGAKKPKEYECPDVPEPIVSLGAPSSYKQDDPSRSTYDEEARKTYLENVEPLRDYNKSIVKIANTYAEGKYDRAAVAKCAQDWLGEWANANALSNLTTETVQLHIGQTLAALSLALLQVQNDPSFDTDVKQKIQRWISSMAQNMVSFVDSRTEKTTSENNIRYWNGYGAAAAGIATNNQSLFDWGINSARIGIDRIATDGTLEAELNRGPRARHYHFFAAAPLVGTAELAAANGINLYNENGGALHRLAKLCINTFDNTSFFEQKTGKPQDSEEDGEIPENMIAWLYLYNQRFPTPEGTAVLSHYKELASSTLGGDVKLLYKR